MDIWSFEHPEVIGTLEPGKEYVVKLRHVNGRWWQSVVIRAGRHEVEPDGGVGLVFTMLAVLDGSPEVLDLMFDYAGRPLPADALDDDAEASPPAG